MKLRKRLKNLLLVFILLNISGQILANYRGGLDQFITPQNEIKAPETTTTRPLERLVLNDKQEVHSIQPLQNDKFGNECGAECFRQLNLVTA